MLYSKITFFVSLKLLSLNHTYKHKLKYFIETISATYYVVCKGKCHSFLQGIDFFRFNMYV